MTLRLPSLRVVLLMFVAFACIGVPGAFAANEFVPLAPIPGLTEGVAATESGIAGFLNNLYLFAIGAAVMLAVIMIIWGGLEYMSESVTKKSEAKKRIYNALFGLVLVLSPALVFSIINPRILNLNISMPELRTKSGGTGGSTAPDTSPVTRPTEKIDSGTPWCYYYGSPRQSDCKATREDCIRAYFDRQGALSTTVGFITCECDSKAGLEGKCGTSF